jgi:hypothetical protein
MLQLIVEQTNKTNLLFTSLPVKCHNLRVELTNCSSSEQTRKSAAPPLRLPQQPVCCSSLLARMPRSSCRRALTYPARFASTLHKSWTDSGVRSPSNVWDVTMGQIWEGGRERCRAEADARVHGGGCSRTGGEAVALDAAA